MSFICLFSETFNWVLSVQEENRRGVGTGEKDRDVLVVILCRTSCELRSVIPNGLVTITSDVR